MVWSPNQDKYWEENKYLKLDSRSEEDGEDLERIGMYIGRYCKRQRLEIKTIILYPPDFQTISLKNLKKCNLWLTAPKGATPVKQTSATD